MSETYDRAAAAAARLLAKYGQDVTLTKAGTATYDPATGTTSTAGGSVQTVSGAVFEYNTFIRSGIRNEPGSLIQGGDKQLLLAPTATDGTALTAPEPDDIARFGGIDYTITAVAPLAPGGQAAYFECNVRA